MTVLVTGATGFVGGRLLRRLVADGRTVRALCRRPEAQDALRAAGAEVFAGDLGDPNAIATAAAGCETIFHCAGEHAHRSDPKALAWIHVAGSENLINAARHAGVRFVIYLSCADVSLRNRDAIHERELTASTRRLTHPWAATKLLGEELALQANSPTMSVTVLRPAWIWGAGDTTTLPILAREALAGRVNLCGGGDNLIATAHVDNVIGAMLAAEDSDGAAGQAAHVADSDNVTAREFLSGLCQALGVQPPRRSFYPVAYAAACLRRLFRTGGAYPFDVIRRGRGRLLDVQVMASGVDYMPEVGVEQGMAALAAWVAAQGGAEAIARMGRAPATAADAAAFEAEADAG